eukprot:TRINITY_DN5204_c0_g2_i1.p1 TRINITY_DN5204_c0_g2~~TRINITY_DN5204_c0_g2_i1.p1  ORF type:complete len:378 (-),score=42.70 TRINITY_DN5204_c0_g2_i1:37-1170(-)
MTVTNYTLYVTDSAYIEGQLYVYGDVVVSNYLYAGQFVTIINGTLEVGQGGILFNQTEVDIRNSQSLMSTKGNMTLLQSYLEFYDGPSVHAAAISATYSGVCGQGSIYTTLLSMNMSTVNFCFRYMIPVSGTQQIEINSDLYLLESDIYIMGSIQYSNYWPLKVSGNLTIDKGSKQIGLHLPAYAVGGWSNIVNLTDVVTFNQLTGDIADFDFIVDLEYPYGSSSSSANFPPITLEISSDAHSISVDMIFFENPSMGGIPYPPLPYWQWSLISCGLGLFIALLFFIPGRRLMKKLFPEEDDEESEAVERHIVNAKDESLLMEAAKRERLFDSAREVEVNHNRHYERVTTEVADGFDSQRDIDDCVNVTSSEVAAAEP